MGVDGEGGWVPMGADGHMHSMESTPGLGAGGDRILNMYTSSACLQTQIFPFRNDYTVATELLLVSLIL